MNLNLCSGPFLVNKVINADMVSYKGVNVICDARSLPFKKESFDNVYFIHSIEHFTYDEAKNILKDIQRVLKKNGTILIEGPDIEKSVKNYSKQYDMVEYLFGALNQIRKNPLYTHKWGYTGEIVSDELKNLGYESVSFEPGTLHGYPNRDYRVTGVKYGGEQYGRGETYSMVFKGSSVEGVSI